MPDVFLSHVKEDFDVVRPLAQGLERLGYSCWYYERDGVPGQSYLIHTGQAVEKSAAVLVVVSPTSIRSPQVTKEVVRGHETGKHFFPILRAISHTEFQNQQPEWREAFGAATSLSLGGDAAELVPQIARGLKALNVLPSGEAGNAAIHSLQIPALEARTSTPSIAGGVCGPDCPLPPC